MNIGTINTEQLDITTLQLNGSYFNFEAEFVEDNVRCIPMIARYKLDACGIKLTLKQWSKMLVEERNIVAATDCSTSEKLLNYKLQLIDIIKRRTNEVAKELVLDAVPEWMQLHKVPEAVTIQCNNIGITLTVQKWQQLPTLQRFALVKLCNSSHEQKNLPHALKEFGLV